MHDEHVANVPSKPWWQVVIVWTGIALFVLLARWVLVTLSSCTPQEAANRSRCTNNLKQIGRALQNYHDTYKSYPPAMVADAEGRPMHSWRMLLLPFLEDRTLEAIYHQYKFDEPWNGPHNAELTKAAPKVYQCPYETRPGVANYLAVTGPETAWPGTATVAQKQIRDGFSKTIQIVEADGTLNWLEPRDLDFALASKIVGHSRHIKGFFALTADGAVHYIRSDVDPKLWRAMLTRDGGEVVTLPDAE